MSSVIRRRGGGFPASKFSIHDPALAQVSFFSARNECRLVAFADKIHKGAVVADASESKTVGAR
jgi:hypothetical protein